MHLPCRLPPGTGDALVVAAVALLARLVWLSHAHVTQTSDFATYHRHALMIIEGRGLPDPYRGVGLPLLLAGLYALVGPSAQAATVAFAALGAIAAGVLTALARLIVSRPASVIAGLLYAVSPTALTYTTLLASENIAVPLTISAVTLIACAQRRRTYGARAAAAVLAGILVGCLVLVRPAGLMFALPCLALLIYDFRQRRWFVSLSILFAAGAALPIAPWLLRNQQVYGAPVLATNGGANLLMGNNDYNTHGGTWSPVLFDCGDANSLERDRVYREAALRWIRANPRRYAALSRTRLCRMLGTTPDRWAARYLRPSRESDDLATAVRLEQAESQALEAARREWSRVRLENEHSLSAVRIVIAPLSLMAAVLALRRWRDFATVLVPAAAYIVGISLLFFQERFREPVQPLLDVPLAALLASIMWGTPDLGAKPRRWIRAVVAVVLIAGTAVGHTTGVLNYLYRVPGPGADPPDASVYEFTQVELRDPADLTPIQPRLVREVELESTVASVSVSVVAGPEISQGGVIIPVPDAEAFRVDLELLEPAHLRVVRVAAVDANREPKWLWLWYFDRAEQQIPVRRTYTFVPGERDAHFTPRTPANKNPVAELHVWVDVAARRRAAFQLHCVEVGQRRPVEGSNSSRGPMVVSPSTSPDR